jgi:hypothetical protein
MSTRKKVVHMVKKYYADPTSITLEDWDKFIKRNFGKLQAQCKKKFPREEWPPGIPYLNFFAYAKHTEMHNPRSEWPNDVPYGDFKARKKQYPRAEWPKVVTYLDFKARDGYYERHHPRAEWPTSIPYLDFKTLEKYEKLFPRADWPPEIPYLDRVAMKPYAERIHQEGVRRETLRLGYGASPSHWGCDRSLYAQAIVQQIPAQDVAQQYPAQPRPEQHVVQDYSSPPQSSQQSPTQSVYYQSPAQPAFQQHSQHHARHPPLANRIKAAPEAPLMSEADINALKHWNAQFDRMHALIRKSRMDLSDVTVQEWQEAAAGTDLLGINYEAVQRMEFSRRLEAGEIERPESFWDMEVLFLELKREWSGVRR